jgi:DNA-binding CsgD family transcriptional regulator
MALNSPKGRAGRPVTNAETARIAERRAEVAGMLLDHRTYREMAELLYCSAATITEDVKSIREAWRERYLSHYHEHAALELAKIDQVERKLWPQIDDGKLAAIETWIKLSRRRAQLLGLDKPERVEATVRRSEPATDGRTIAEVLTSAMAKAKAESTNGPER